MHINGESHHPLCRLSHTLAETESANCPNYSTLGGTLPGQKNGANGDRGGSRGRDLSVEINPRDGGILEAESDRSSSLAEQVENAESWSVDAGETGFDTDVNLSEFDKFFPEWTVKVKKEFLF